MGGVFNNEVSFRKEAGEGVVPIGGAVRNVQGLSERGTKEDIEKVSVREEEANRNKKGGRDQIDCTRDRTVCENADCVVRKGAKLNLTYGEA